MLAGQIPLLRDDSMPKTLIEFTARFCDETACADVLRRWKYSGRGFVCGHCGGTRAWYLPSRRLDECRTCHRQMSLTAGTVMHGSRKPLRTWFLAIYLFVQSKQGISALELKRELSLGSYQTAWAWLHKLRRAVRARPNDPLSGTVEADETWEGGLHEGHPGRPTAGEKKVLVAGAIEVSSDRRSWGRVRLASIPNGSAASRRDFLERRVATGSTLLTDDWKSYRKPCAELGLAHRPINVSKSDSEAHVLLPAVHRVFSLLHRVLITTHQGAVSRKHLALYLAEFEFRFNRRRSSGRGLVFQRTLSASVVSAPPYYWQIVGRRNAKTPLKAVA